MYFFVADPWTPEEIWTILSTSTAHAKDRTFLCRFQNGFAERKTGIVDDPELFLKTALEFESATKREEDDEEPSCSMFSKRHPLRGVRRLPRRTFEFVQRTGRRPFSKLTETRRKKAEPCCSVH